LIYVDDDCYLLSVASSQMARMGHPSSRYMHGRQQARPVVRLRSHFVLLLETPFIYFDIACFMFVGKEF
jgi:hypothetical protein